MIKKDHGKKSIKRNQLKLESCESFMHADPTHSSHPLGFKSIINETFDSYDLANRYCLDPSEVADLYVYGNERSKEQAKFTINLEKCVNTT